MENWSIELSDWTKANKDSLELIHSKANDSFNSTISINNIISARAFTFISILIPVIYFIIGLLWNKAIESSETISLQLLIYVFALSVPSMLCLWLLIKIIYPRKMMVAGREIKEIAIPDFIQNDDLLSHENYLALLIGEIEELQQKITYNENVNGRRLRALKLVMNILSITLYSSILLLFGYSFFSKIETFFFSFFS